MIHSRPEIARYRLRLRKWMKRRLLNVLTGLSLLPARGGGVVPVVLV